MQVYLQEAANSGSEGRPRKFALKGRRGAITPLPFKTTPSPSTGLAWPRRASAGAHVDGLNPQNTALEAIFPVELKEVIQETFALKGRRDAAPLPFKLPLPSPWFELKGRRDAIAPLPFQTTPSPSMGAGLAQRPQGPPCPSDHVCPVSPRWGLGP